MARLRRFKRQRQSGESDLEFSKRSKILLLKTKEKTQKARPCCWGPAFFYASKSLLKFRQLWVP